MAEVSERQSGAEQTATPEAKEQVKAKLGQISREGEQRQAEVSEWQNESPSEALEDIASHASDSTPEDTIAPAPQQPASDSTVESTIAPASAPASAQDDQSLSASDAQQLPTDGKKPSHQEMQAMLEEQLQRVFEEVEAYRFVDIKNIAETGKTASGESVKSQYLGDLDPEIAKYLATSLLEGKTDSKQLDKGKLTPLETALAEKIDESFTQPSAPADQKQVETNLK